MATPKIVQYKDVHPQPRVKMATHRVYYKPLRGHPASVQMAICTVATP
jgi:hypothetical protein